MSLLATSLQRPSLTFQAAKPVSRVSVRSVRVIAKGTGPGAGNSDPQKVKEQKDAKVRPPATRRMVDRCYASHVHTHRGVSDCRKEASGVNPTTRILWRSRL